MQPPPKAQCAEQVLGHLRKGGKGKNGITAHNQEQLYERQEDEFGLVTLRQGHNGGSPTRKREVFASRPREMHLLGQTGSGLRPEKIS